MSTREEQFIAELVTLAHKYPEFGFRGCATAVEIKSTKRFLISMLGFQNLTLSKMCVEAILCNSKPGTFELRLTNNGSSDGTREYFNQMALENPGVISVHHNETNRGFIEPNNEAFEYARANGFEFCVLANNDMEPPAGWLEHLAIPMDTIPSAAITGPLGGCSGLNSDMNGDTDQRLEYIEGSAMMIKVKCIQPGPLFSRYLDFIYNEDSDLCLRLQFRGYTIHRCPFRIKHRGSQTAGAHPEAKKRCAEANAKNRETMKRVWAHWNRVRRFNYPIVIKRRFAVGDVLLTTPVIRALHERFPLCPIHVETDYPDIFKENPCVASAGPMVAITHMKDPLVIDLDGCYERTPNRHVIHSYAIAAGLDPVDVGRKLEIYGATTKMNAASKWCAVHVGPTTWPGKNWPMDRWNEVVQLIRHRGYKVMLFGNPPRDASILCDRDYRGQSGIAEFIGLMAQCNLFVGLDSFPAHLACALEIPSVVLFGITEATCFAARTAPYKAVEADASHPDAGRRNREANVTFIETTDEVMRTISVIDVIGGVDEIINRP